MRDNVKGWREVREMLKETGFDTELEHLELELLAIRRAVESLNVPDDLHQQGICLLLATVANKVSDMRHGRIQYELLPK